MNILLVGINGKMGQMLKSIAISKNYNIVAGIDKNTDKDEKTIKIFDKFEQIPQLIVNNIDIVIDFALPEIIDEELDFCIKNNKKLVICSTGHNQKQLQKIKQASNIVPVFKTANTSIGVALLEKMLQDNLNILSEYQIEIIEKHHKNKIDKPSGTAKELLKILNDKPNCYSIRAGSVVGEHEILLFGNEEQISIKHKAESRGLFAFGAIKIAEFMQTQNSAKLYTMKNLLNAK